jgi:hypothetical protein
MSQQLGVSANIIPNSAAAIFSPKKKEQRQNSKGIVLLGWKLGLVWRNRRKKIAKLSMTTFTYCSSSKLQ